MLEVYEMSTGILRYYIGYWDGLGISVHLYSDNLDNYDMELTEYVYRRGCDVYLLRRYPHSSYLKLVSHIQYIK